MTANNRTGQKMAGQTEKDTDRARTGEQTGKGEQKAGNIHNSKAGNAQGQAKDTRGYGQ